VSHRDRDRSNARKLALELVRVRDLAYDRVHNYELDPDLAANLMHSATRANELATRLNVAVDLDLAGDFDRDTYTDLGRASRVIWALGHDLGRARARAGDMYSRYGLRVGGNQDVAMADVISPPGRVPQCLVALAVQVLPVPDRPRYAEEFRVELVDVPHRERLRYAFRILAGAWQLRRALTELPRTSDGVPVRRVKER
jgi:hypothetical protein